MIINKDHRLCDVFLNTLTMEDNLNRSCYDFFTSCKKCKGTLEYKRYSFKLVRHCLKFVFIKQTLKISNKSIPLKTFKSLCYEYI